MRDDDDDATQDSASVITNRSTFFESICRTTKKAFDEKVQSVLTATRTEIAEAAKDGAVEIELENQMTNAAVAEILRAEGFKIHFCHADDVISIGWLCGLPEEAD